MKYLAAPQRCERSLCPRCQEAPAFTELLLLHSTREEPGERPLP